MLLTISYKSNIYIYILKEKAQGEDYFDSNKLYMETDEWWMEQGIRISMCMQKLFFIPINYNFQEESKEAQATTPNPR